MEKFLPKNYNINHLKIEENKHPFIQSILRERNKSGIKESHNSATPIIPNVSKIKKLNILITKKEDSLDNNKKTEINEYSYLKDKKDKIYSSTEGSKTNSIRNSFHNRNSNSNNIIYKIKNDNELIYLNSDNQQKSITNSIDKDKKSFNNLNTINKPQSNNNVFFPKLRNLNPLNIKKFNNFRKELTEKDLLYKKLNNNNINKINFKLNSINNHKTKSFKNIFFKVSSEDKTKSQKSDEFRSLWNRPSNNFSISKISNQGINTENLDNEDYFKIENNKNIKINNNLINQFENNNLSNLINNKNENEKEKIKENDNINKSQINEYNNPMIKLKKSYFNLLNKSYIPKIKIPSDIIRTETFIASSKQMNDVITKQKEEKLKELNKIKNFNENNDEKKKSEGIIKSRNKSKILKRLILTDVNSNINNKIIINSKNNSIISSNISSNNSNNIKNNNNINNKTDNNINNNNINKINNSNSNINKSNGIIKKKILKNKQSTNNEILKNINNTGNKKINNKLVVNFIHNNKAIPKKFEKNLLLKNNFKSEILSTTKDTLNNKRNIENKIVFKKKISRLKTFRDKNNTNNENIVSKEEKKFRRKKRKKIVNLMNESNESSYIYNSYVDEIKNYYLNKVVSNKIAGIIFDDFEPLKNHAKSRREIRKFNRKDIKFFFNFLLKGNIKFFVYFTDEFENLIELLSIQNDIRVANSYILKKFNNNDELLKKYKLKWNTKKVKELKIKKSINVFYESINKGLNEGSNEERTIQMNVLDQDFYVYIERMKKDLVIKNDAFYFGLVSDEYDNLDSIIKKKEEKEKINENNKSKIEDDNQKVFFEKIKNEFGNIDDTESKKKFIKIFPHLSRSKIDTKIYDDIKDKYKSSKKLTSLNIKDDEEQQQQQQQINKIKNNLEQFNILRNKKMFDLSKFKVVDRRGTNFSAAFNLRKLPFQSEKRLPLNQIKMNIRGIEDLDTEDLLIKAKEKEKESPEIILFDEMVSILNSRKILTFNELFEDEEEDILKIINYQEFPSGNTLLIYAVRNNLKSAVELLLLKGADPNLQNKFGNSALHAAYKVGNPYIINLLLEYGADKKIKNKRGLYPWQFSKSNN